MSKYISATDSLRPGQLNRLTAKIKDSKPKDITPTESPMTRQDLEHDILVLVLRLLDEDPDTFSIETREVMERWSEKARSVLRGEHIYEMDN